MPNCFLHWRFLLLFIVPQHWEWIPPTAIAIVQLDQRLCYRIIGLFTILLQFL
uniref:Uncharacterized protein n=1 Tax=Arundo donax TaxID=35708 RepID=A0A0A9AGY9_ARUDO